MKEGGLSWTELGSGAKKVADASCCLFVFDISGQEQTLFSPVSIGDHPYSHSWLRAVEVISINYYYYYLQLKPHLVNFIANSSSPSSPPLLTSSLLPLPAHTTLSHQST